MKTQQFPMKSLSFTLHNPKELIGYMSSELMLTSGHIFFKITNYVCSLWKFR
jgi:hypothetical protein